MATVREPDRLAEDEESQRDRLRSVEGHMTPAQRRPRYGQPFWPVTIFGSAMYITATAAALIILSLIHPADSFYSLPNNGAVIPADPINHTAYNPRPEWYFLFLFQILKYFQGPWELVGTAVIPGILSVLLIGLPFYDRNWSRRAVRRPIAMGSMGLALVLLAYLTYSPLSSSAPGAASSDYLSTVAAKPTYANIQAIFAKNCQPCHYNSPYPLGLNLTSYQGVTAGGTGAGQIPKKVIVPGNAKASYLWQVIEWVQKAGNTMPAGKPEKIPQVDRTNIANWINNGAKGK